MVYRFLAMGVLSCVTLLTVTPQKSYGQEMNIPVTSTGAQQTDEPGSRVGVPMSTVSSNVREASVPSHVSHEVASPPTVKGRRATHGKRIKKIRKNTKPQFYPPALDKNGSIYFASCSGKITAIDPNGSTKWLMQLPNRICTGFTIGQNNTLYFSSDNALYAVGCDGRMKWTFNTDNAIAFPAIVDKQENIYIVTARDNLLYAIRPDGSQHWKVHIDGDIAMQPSITAEGNIYVAVHNKSLYAINPDGEFNWRRRIFSKPPENHTPAPATDNDVTLDSASASATITKPIAGSPGQPIPEALRISRRRPEIEETTLQQNDESATTSFVASTQKGYAPLRVEFLDTSTGDVVDRYWDFGDGTLVNSDRNPTHTYTIPGSYSISFTTKRMDMVSTIIKKQYITVLDVPASNSDWTGSAVMAENKGTPFVPTQTSVVLALPMPNVDESDAKDSGMQTASTQITTASEGRKPIKYFPQKTRE